MPRNGFFTPCVFLIVILQVVFVFSGKYYEFEFTPRNEDSHLPNSDARSNRECFCTYDYENSFVKARLKDRILKKGDTIMRGETVSFECKYVSKVLTWQNGFRFFGRATMVCNTCEEWKRKDLPTCKPAIKINTVVGYEHDLDVLPGGIVQVRKGENRQFFCSNVWKQPQWDSGKAGVSVNYTEDSAQEESMFISYLYIKQADDEHSGTYECFTRINKGQRTTSSRLNLQVVETPACQAREFKCDDGQCVSADLRCDRRFDCRDGTDELNCEPPACRASEFKCDDGQCISADSRCDRFYDCRDRTDELNCEPPACRASEFKCDDGQCISADSHCDRFFDCRDRTDELNCAYLRDTARLCELDEFGCLDGQCIKNDLKCNGRLDCIDGSDESSCDTYCIVPVIKNGEIGKFESRTSRWRTSKEFLKVPPGDIVSSDQKLFLRCEEGFSPRDSIFLENNLLEVICLDGYWTEVPQCVRMFTDVVSCSKFPMFAGLQVEYSDNVAVGSVAKFNCLSSQLIGSSYSRCLENGSWSHPAPVCIKEFVSCSKFPVFAGLQVEYSNGVSVGSVAKFSCSSSQLTGSSYSRCLENGSWSHPAPLCIKDLHCSIGELVLSLSDEVEIDMTKVDNELVSPGEEVKLKCFDSVISGNSYAMCDEHGRWKLDNFQCVPGCLLDVDPFSDIQILPMKDSYRTGEIVQLSCPRKYKLSENVEKIMCLNGVWSDPLPECIEDNEML